MWPFKRRGASAPDGVDLRGLPSIRIRVRGTTNYIPDELREHVGGTVYMLRREPDNVHDGSAIGVFWEGRKVGYVSAAKAAALAPLLDRIGGDVVVSGMGAYTSSIRLWVDLPRVPELRRFVDQASS